MKMTAECVKIKFQLTARSCIIRDLIEDMDLMIDILDIFQRRERDGCNLTHPLDIRRIPQENCKTSLSVTASPAGLLEICLGTVRDIEMHHESDIRLVNTHSECIGTHHHPYLVLLPLFLSVGT